MSDPIHTTLVVFKEIPNWPGYRVGDDGSVWSRRKHGKILDSWHLLRPRVNSNGYKVVFLCLSRKVRWHVAVHRLVLETFVGPRPEGMECRHFPDSTKTNNRLENLRWGTAKENRADASAAGVLGNNRGARNGHAKLTEDDVKLIRVLHKQGVRTAVIANRFGVGTECIYRAVIGKSWSYLSS